MLNRKVPDLLVSGNIDLSKRPIVRNKDGTISTVLSFSKGMDDGEVLLPLVSDDGRIMTEDEAVLHYLKTGNHLGIFSNPDAASRYAKQLHINQEKMYKGAKK